MTTPDSAAIERFMRAQVTCWNAHDKAGFLALYREIAPDGLDIEYVGRNEQHDGWFVIEEMYDKHNDQIELQVVATIINGNEAAIHHFNCIRGTSQVIESIETYRFTPGRLSVRYYLKPPAGEGVGLEQFRGFA
jgi:hypothetical protein